MRGSEAVFLTSSKSMTDDVTCIPDGSYVPGNCTDIILITSAQDTWHSVSSYVRHQSVCGGQRQLAQPDWLHASAWRHVAVFSSQTENIQRFFFFRVFAHVRNI